MIKLTQLISELGINNPHPTAEEVCNYYNNIFLDSINFNLNSKGWKEYREICKPYIENNSNIEGRHVGYGDFEYLPQSDLNKLYREMRQLVRKYTNINKLQINNPNKTAEEVMDYYESAFSNIDYANFIRIVKPIVYKYGYKFPMGVRDFIMSLDQQTLNKLYRELKSEFD